jgi:hypothetical protein
VYDRNYPKWYEGCENVAPNEFLWDLALTNTSRLRKETVPIDNKVDDFMEKIMEEEEDQERVLLQRNG